MHGDDGPACHCQRERMVDEAGHRRRPAEVGVGRRAGEFGQPRPLLGAAIAAGLRDLVSDRGGRQQGGLLRPESVAPPAASKVRSMNFKPGARDTPDSAEAQQPESSPVLARE